MITISVRPSDNSFNFSHDPFIIKGTATGGSGIEKRVVATVALSFSTGENYTLPDVFYDPDAGTGFFTWNLRTIISKLFESVELPLMNLNTPAIFRNYRSYATATITINEYDGADHDTIDTTSFTCYLFRGGTSWESYPSFYFMQTYQPANKPLLNWDLDGKQLPKDFTEYITFLQPSGVTDWKLKVTSYDYANNLLGSFYTTPVDPGETDTVGTYNIPVGYNNLSLGTKSYAASIVKWVVQVVKTSDNSVLSAAKSFILDTRHYRNRRDFYYVNSLGGLSSFMFTGESEISNEVTKTTIAKVEPIDYFVQHGQRKNINFSGQDIIVLNTGFKPQSEINRIREMMLSPYVYEKVFINGNIPGVELFPVEISSNSIKLGKDNDFLHFASFEYKYLFRNSQYTPLK